MSGPGAAHLAAAVRTGELDPVDLAARAHGRAQAQGLPAWISVLPWDVVRSYAEAARGSAGALAGVPFAIKDNIDLAGTETTAACPEFAFAPEASATVVQRLVAAGAVPIGKTNLDQFATGLAGTRTPYGACASVVDGRLISGGSSSGSAVVVADGTVPFALGTDTAGSGRVPAAANGLVGLKPTRGRLSTVGVLPACRSLDCPSVFTRDVADAALVLAVLDGVDPADPFGRVAPAPPVTPGTRGVLAVPRADQVVTGGDAGAAVAWAAALAAAKALDFTLVEVDFAPFAEAAALLYDGPWIAERDVAMGAFLDAHPDAVDPVVARLVRAGRGASAVALFAAQHRLAELRLITAGTWAGAEALLVPTAPTIPTHAEVAADPVGTVAMLGTYTNFANLLDLSALAVPCPLRPDGRPFGVTFVGPAGADERLLSLGARWLGEEVDAVVERDAPVPLAG